MTEEYTTPKGVRPGSAYDTWRRAGWEHGRSGKKDDDETVLEAFVAERRWMPDPDIIRTAFRSGLDKARRTP